MPDAGLCLFDTAIGRCALGWNERGIASVQLPGPSDAQLRARVRGRLPDAEERPLPPRLEAAVARIRALLAGAADDLSDLPLDMEHVPPFHRRVYEHARRVAPGSTTTYGELAARAGAPGGARAVGQAMGKNPFPIVVPCHRVLAAGGRVGGFSAPGGVSTKLRMLAIEQRPPAASTPPLDAVRAVEHLARVDPALARAIRKIGPVTVRIDPEVSVFRALAEAIVYQQLHAKAAATIFARVLALAPGGALEPTSVLAISDAALRGAGLSQAKLRALRDLAAKAAAGELPTREEAATLDDEALIARLTAVRGVGRWTAAMFLVFRLGRSDVLAPGDLGLRKGLAVLLRRSELPTEDELAARAQRWRPFRSAASWYLWRLADGATLD